MSCHVRSSQFVNAGRLMKLCIAPSIPCLMSLHQDQIRPAASSCGFIFMRYCSSPVTIGLRNDTFGIPPQHHHQR